MTINDDTDSLMTVLATWEEAPGDAKRGHRTLAAKDVHKALADWSTERFNDAISVLVKRGYVEEDDTLGSHPYEMNTLTPTVEGRLAYEEVAVPSGKRAVKTTAADCGPASGKPSNISSPEAQQDYDVAVSFAGEDRQLVEPIVRALQDRGIKVFYDGDVEDELWGKNLVDYLHDLYLHRARYCLMFVSAAYSRKAWPNHERQAAQERSFNHHDIEYILPVRIDATAVPGLPGTIGYISIGKGTEKIAELVCRKLIGPTVVSVTPSEAILGERTVFTVRGEFLPPTLAAWIHQGRDLRWLSRSSPNEARFACTPSWTGGSKQILVKDKPKGKVLWDDQIHIHLSEAADVAAEILGHPAATSGGFNVYLGRGLSGLKDWEDFAKLLCRRIGDIGLSDPWDVLIEIRTAEEAMTLEAENESGADAEDLTSGVAYEDQRLYRLVIPSSQVEGIHECAESMADSIVGFFDPVVDDGNGLRGR